MELTGPRRDAAAQSNPTIAVWRLLAAVALAVAVPLSVVAIVTVRQVVTEEREKAAESYAVIYAALKEPSKYDLDFRASAALRADPRTSYERIGTVLMEGGKLDLAGEAFEQAAKTNRASAGNLTYNRAKLLLLSNKAEDALAELQKYFAGQAWYKPNPDFKDDMLNAIEAKNLAKIKEAEETATSKFSEAEG